MLLREGHGAYRIGPAGIKREMRYGLDEFLIFDAVFTAFGRSSGATSGRKGNCSAEISELILECS